MESGLVEKFDCFEPGWACLSLVEEVSETVEEIGLWGEYSKKQTNQTSFPPPYVVSEVLRPESGLLGWEEKFSVEMIKFILMIKK